MYRFYFTFFTVWLICYCVKGENTREDYDNLDTRYLLYDVNPPEGFNLRRDVYMRIAVLMKHLLDLGQPWKLVLPPWGGMYHWQSKDLGEQSKIPWGTFFDLESLQGFIPVIEMYQFLKETGRTNLDEVYVLQHFSSAWVDGKWEEKMSIEDCHEEIPYQKLSGEEFKGWFWGYRNISAASVKCLSFQGHATSLIPLLINATDSHSRTIMIDHAEIALHHMFGDNVYWQVRRSMRFANHLHSIANEFRNQYLDSSDDLDNTIRPSDWKLEKKKEISEERGGNYLSVHLRRKDFTWGRAEYVPSIIGAAAQLGAITKKHKLKTIFIATDGSKEEMKELKSLLKPLKVLLFRPTSLQRQQLKDGGIAIVEQIICSHAKLFYGTHESTFSFRIQEEREIMGFHPDNTFNRLCGDDEIKCVKPTRWRIDF